MDIRRWYVDEALHSVRRLINVQDKLTFEEACTALEAEAASRRRPTIIKRLIDTAVARYRNQLKEKYQHGPSQVRNRR